MPLFARLYRLPSVQPPGEWDMSPSFKASFIRVPSLARRFEGCDNLIVETDGRSGVMDTCKTAATDKLLTNMLVRPIKKFVGQFRSVVRVSPSGVNTAFARVHLRSSY
jgi:hypothetical protein